MQGEHQAVAEARRLERADVLAPVVLLRLEAEEEWLAVPVPDVPRLWLRRRRRKSGR
jgi:hypothetical protein